MSTNWHALRINPDRFLSDFAELSRIGATGDGGVHRPALTEPDLQARAWLRGRFQAAGLDLRQDPAGNISGFLPCGSPDAPALLLGSHLDSVPFGGRFDGALGVLAALETLRVVKEAGLSLPVNLEAIDFTDEEGTLTGFLGSGALTGSLHPDVLENPKCGLPYLNDRLSAAGLSLETVLDARRPQGSLAGYLELHIEQGKRLEQRQVQIGVVDTIVGITAYRISYLGRADHSGTTPLNDRLDAGQGAAAFILDARETVLRDYPGCMVNIGQASFEPGAFNIVPRKANLGLEFRSGDEKQLGEMEMDLLKSARKQANRFGLLIGAEHLWTEPPAQMDERARSAIAAAAGDLGLSHMPLSSGAGHDAQMLSTVCPAGMIFVPSVDGASHSSREDTRDEDCINGANVLLQAALRMAGL